MGKFEIVIGKSRALTIFFLALYGGTTVIWISIPIPILLKILGVAFLWNQGWITLRRHARRTSKNAIIRLWQDSKGQWGCQTKAGHSAKAILKTDSFKCSRFMVLRFGLKARSISVMICRDAVHSSEYRTLSNRFNMFK
jgi:hypothetical protein